MYTHDSVYTRGNWTDIDDSASEAYVAIGDSLDIRSLLESSTPAQLIVMGAVLEPVPEIDDDTSDICGGESMVNSRLAARAAVDSSIIEVQNFWRLAEFEVPHVFEEGDVAYLHDS